MVRTAIIHDFFVTEGGAEQCAIEFAKLLPEASVFTSFFDADRFGDRIDPRRVHTWPLARVSAAPATFRSLLPLYAAYFGTLRVHADLVVSSSIAFAKAVLTPPGAAHIAYVYTPMRYAWDLDTYLAGSSYSRVARLAARTIRPALRRWDRRTAARPTAVIAISNTVRRRIETLWHRAVDDVVYPPVSVDEIPFGQNDDGYLLVAARLLAYRRIDLAVEAATATGRPLRVVGDGPELRRLQAMAGPTVEFLGRISRPALLEQFARCHAYLVPGIEDFGIAPVEAMAAGKPVVAFRGGGATETVVEGRTGVFFDRPTAASLAAAIAEMERVTFAPEMLRRHARTFDVSVFRSRWRSLLGAGS